MTPAGYRAVEMSLTEARRDLPAAIRAAKESGRITIVTVSGDQAAVIGPLSLLSGSLAEEIERLASLHDRGKLTDEEFAAAKRQLLGGG